MSSCVEEYQVKVTRDAKTGKINSENWYLHGKLHRVEGPAARVFDPNTGALIVEEWHRDGSLLREGGPARTTFDAQTRHPTFEVWRNHHGVHRPDDLPAKTNWCANTGNVTSMRFYEYDLEHRENGPSHIQFGTDGKTIVFEEWRRHELMSREGGLPAITERDENTGVIVREEYWIANYLHRDSNKPAIIYRDAGSGEVTHQFFYEHGQELDTSNIPNIQP